MEVDINHSPFTKQEGDRIITLKLSGLSSRKICTKMGWSTTRKSTVNYYIKRRLECLNSALDEIDNNNKPKILFWDLESSLMHGMFFRIWKENIPFQRIDKHTHLISTSWAFNNQPVQNSVINYEDVKTGNDFDVVVKMVEAVNSADLMVTFNGKRFDTKLLNTRALYWGLPPVKPVKHIDLFEQAKRVFKFPSNSMQNIASYLGLEGKVQTGGTQLWERCANWSNEDNCRKALVEMVTYGDQDIEVTRDVYNHFQGWMKGIPNIATIEKSKSGVDCIKCSHCASTDVTMIDTKTYTSTSCFDLYRCGNSGCRGVSRITSNGKNLVGVV